MTNAPERIWAKDKYDTWGTLGDWYASGAGGGVSYTRTDLYTAACEERDAMRAALEKLLNHYVETANSGDCGFWDCEQEEVVIAARQAMKGTPQ